MCRTASLPNTVYTTGDRRYVPDRNGVQHPRRRSTGRTLDRHVRGRDRRLLRSVRTGAATHRVTELYERTLLRVGAQRSLQSPLSTVCDQYCVAFFYASIPSDFDARIYSFIHDRFGDERLSRVSLGRGFE